MQAGLLTAAMTKRSWRDLEMPSGFSPGCLGQSPGVPFFPRLGPLSPSS